MRTWPVVVVSLFAPAVALAEVWQDRVIPCEPGLAALTSSSRILYVNDCKPGGCNVTRSSQDSALNNTSSIASANTTMSAYQHSDAHFAEVMECVRATMAPFDIQVTTDDPGPGVPHFEVMVAGTSNELNPNIEGAGGIAPFINCGVQRNSVLSFVFANMTADVEYLCTAIVHEAGHTYGLTHTLEAADPMSYQDLGAYEKQWQNGESRCTRDHINASNCSCSMFPGRQNSFRFLKDSFGLNPALGDATLTITTPANGAYVKPGFPIAAQFETGLETLSAGMAIDNGTEQPAANGLLAWNAPTTIAPGAHTITVEATDFGDRTVAQTVEVTVLSTCVAGGSCASGFSCLGGTCLPGADVAGGLGASCTDNAECITGSCASDGSTSLCTATCDGGTTCPSGFECTSNICWPTDDGGGCNAGSGSMGALLGLAGLLTLFRRRR